MERTKRRPAGRVHASCVAGLAGTPRAGRLCTAHCATQRRAVCIALFKASDAPGAAAVSVARPYAGFTCLLCSTILEALQYQFFKKRKKETLKFPGRRHPSAVGVGTYRAAAARHANPCQCHPSTARLGRPAGGSKMKLRGPGARGGTCTDARCSIRLMAPTSTYVRARMGLRVCV